MKHTSIFLLILISSLVLIDARPEVPVEANVLIYDTVPARRYTVPAKESVKRKKAADSVRTEPARIDDSASRVNKNYRLRDNVPTPPPAFRLHQDSIRLKKKQ